MSASSTDPARAPLTPKYTSRTNSENGYPPLGGEFPNWPVLTALVGAGREQSAITILQLIFPGLISEADQGRENSYLLTKELLCRGLPDALLKNPLPKFNYLRAELTHVTTSHLSFESIETLAAAFPNLISLEGDTPSLSCVREFPINIGRIESLVSFSIPDFATARGGTDFEVLGYLPWLPALLSFPPDDREAFICKIIEPTLLTFLQEQLPIIQLQLLVKNLNSGPTLEQQDAYYGALYEQQLAEYPKKREAYLTALLKYEGAPEWAKKPLEVELPQRVPEAHYTNSKTALFYTDEKGDLSYIRIGEACYTKSELLSVITNNPERFSFLDAAPFPLSSRKNLPGNSSPSASERIERAFIQIIGLTPKSQHPLAMKTFPNPLRKHD